MDFKAHNALHSIARYITFWAALISFAYLFPVTRTASALLLLPMVFLAPIILARMADTGMARHEALKTQPNKSKTPLWNPDPDLHYRLNARGEAVPLRD